MHEKLTEVRWDDTERAPVARCPFCNNIRVLSIAGPPFTVCRHFRCILERRSPKGFRYAKFVGEVQNGSVI